VLVEWHDGITIQEVVFLKTGWAILVVLSFLGWIGCTVGFIFGAFQRDNRFNNRKALLWGGAVVACYALWVLGMMYA